MYPSEIQDMYLRLGITSEATSEEIKKAYREKALYWHPDKNPQIREKAHLEFIAISEAFERLYPSKKSIREPLRKERKTYSYYEDLFKQEFGKEISVLFEVLETNPTLKVVVRIFENL